MTDYKTLGNDAYQAKQYPQAVEHYTNGINEDNQNAALFSNRSAAYLKMGDVEKAKLDADICIQLDPKWSKGWWRKGMAQIDAQDYNGARKTFKDGLEQCPTDNNLLAGLEKANKFILVADSVQGPGEAAHEYDMDGPSKRNNPDPNPANAVTPPEPVATSPQTPHDGPKWPGNAQQEIDRIKLAPNHYAVLHVSTDSSNPEMKKNYYTLAKLLHPDKCQLEGAEDAMTSVSQAYSTLTNVIKKTMYDQYLSQAGGDADRPPQQTYQEWESNQQHAEMPKWLTWLLNIKGCGWILILVLFIIMLPLCLIVLIIFIICYPVQIIMSVCFPEKYARMKEEQEKKQAKREEEAQDAAFAHV